MPPLPSFPGDWGGLSSTGSTASDSAGRATLSTITLTIGRPLTSLTVELRVLMTPEVAGTSAFSSDSAQTGVTVGDEGGFLVYRWTLDAGQVLQPGTYTFSGQFSHAAGRDTSGDSYSVIGDGETGPVSSGGGF